MDFFANYLQETRADKQKKRNCFVESIGCPKKKGNRIKALHILSQNWSVDCLIN